MMTSSPNHPRWPLAQVLVFLAIVWTALAWPWLSGAVAIPWDAKAHFQPQLSFLAQSIARGEWPFWTPFVFAGSPQIADPQSLIFAPPFLALASVNSNPSLAAADAALFALVLAGAAAIVLLFQHRRWHPAAALLAAIVFAFGGSAAWRIQHVGQIMSYAWWPIAWLCLERALGRSSLTYGIAAGLAAGFMALGRDQVAYLAAWHLIAIVLWHILARDDNASRSVRFKQAVLPLLAGVLTGLTVVGIPIIMTMLLQGDSNRVAIDVAGAERGSLHPAHLLTMIVPKLFGTAGPLEQHWGPPSPIWGPVDLYLARNMGHLYLGSLPLAALVGIGIGAGRFGARGIRLTLAATIIMLVYALGRYTPLFGMIYHVMPGVALFRRPADATFLIGGFGAILAGYGLHRLLSDAFIPLRNILATAAVLFALGLITAAFVANAKGQLDYATWPLVQAALAALLALGALIILRRLRAQPILACLVVAMIMIVDLGWNNGPSESTALPSTTYDVLRPDSADPTIAWLKTHAIKEDARRDRIELAGIGFHWPNASLVHRLDNTLGYNPVRLKWYADATGAGDHVALPDQRKFSNLMPSYRSHLANLLGLRFIATGVPIEQIDKTMALAPLPLVARTPDAFIYENPQALPRVRRLERWRQADPDLLIASGQWPDGYDPKRETILPLTAMLPSVERGPADAPDTPTSTRIVSYGNMEVVVETSGARRGVVVLTDVWHPWWVAEIDGKPVDIMRADAIFRGVVVPAGQREVRFVFRPFAGAWAELKRRLAHVAQKWDPVLR
jgi:hypothetical protein